MIEVIVKKTFELSIAEKEQMVNLFNAISEKNRSVNAFEEQYSHNSFGYSYHALLVDDDKVEGCSSYIPNHYVMNGEKKAFCNGVDTMVSRPYRDFFNLYDMIIGAYDYMRKDGILLVYAFPNDNAYPVYKKSKLYFEIGRLDTYCLPYRIGGVKPKLKILNPLSILFSEVLVFITSIFSSNKIYGFLIEKGESYYKTRYKWFGGEYEIIDKDGVYFTYKVRLHEGIRTAFLIDVMPKSAKNINKAVRYMINKEKSNFDLMLYVGKLPFRNIGLIKIPRKFEPKNFNFAAKILDERYIDRNLVFGMSNWDVNLSNYDLI